MDFSDYPLPANATVFCVTAAAVWFCGTHLSRYADLLAGRWGLEAAFAGVLLLGTTTSLPDIAATATAAWDGDASLVGGNLLGGIAIRIAILAVTDIVVMRGRPLTVFSAEPGLLMQGILSIFLASLAIAAVTGGEIGSVAGIGVWSLLIFASYLGVLYVIYRYDGRSHWVPTGDALTPPERSLRRRAERDRRDGATSTARAALLFACNSAGVLVAGWLVAEACEALAVQTGLGSGFVGATLLSFATSLPETSTTIAAVRIGSYGLAVGNIFGGNCLTLALFPLADAFYRGGLTFQSVDPSAGFLAALGIAVTCVYLWGILERRDRTVLGMGQDSAAVLVLYTAGMAVYYAIRPQ